MKTSTTTLLLSLLVTAVPALAQSPVYSGVQPGTTAFLGGFVVTNTPSPITQLFDIVVTDPNGITITQIDCRTSTSHGTAGQFGVWMTAPNGTHVSNHLNASLWTQVASQTQTHNGGVVSWVLPTPIPLAAGTYGMALHYIQANPIYTNPNSPTPTLPTTYSSAELTLDMSSARVRRSDPVDPFGGTSNGFSPRHPNIAVHYVQGAVSVNFAGTPTTGASPLPVQFTSYAVSGNPGGILAWLWDFENDGTVDSTLQNPLHTYSQCGTYDVLHTVVDSTGPHSELKTSYIQTDIVDPGFTSQLIAANTMQFTDTSVPTPTSWDWDLDGDGTTDSTLQNPVFTYTTACTEVDVTLTATLACQPSVSLTKPIAIASSLETIRQGGLIISSTAIGGTNFLDVTVANPQGITICGMHVRSNLAAAQPLTVNVWQKDGTYVGAETTPAVWRQIANETVNAAGPGVVTFVSFATPLYLAPGTHGLGVQQLGASPTYTNLGQMQTYSNADLSITAGATMAEPLFGAASTIYSPRIWNGAIYYSTSSTTGAAGYGYFGEGCAGTLGVPRNVAQSQPLAGTTMTVAIDSLPGNAAIFLLGLSRTSSVFGPLPLDMTQYGAPGCFGRVSPDAPLLILGTGNAATFPFPIPAGTSYIGVQLYTQAFAIDIGFNQLGGVMSDAAAMIIGM